MLNLNIKFIKKYFFFASTFVLKQFKTFFKIMIPNEAYLRVEVNVRVLLQSNVTHVGVKREAPQ